MLQDGGENGMIICLVSMKKIKMYMVMANRKNLKSKKEAR